MTIRLGQIARRLLAAAGIGVACSLATLALVAIPGAARLHQLASWVFYDWFYGNRPIESQLDGDVVIIAVDDGSLAEIEQTIRFGWPWPRDGWALIVQYLDSAGARAVGFDILFRDTSAKGVEDDESFGSMIDETRTPLAFGRTIQPNGEWGRFKPKISRPHEFGGVDPSDELTYREYLPQRHDKPTLATATLQAAGIKPRLPVDEPFLLHFYGPHRDPTDRPTFQSVRASRVMLAQNNPDEDTGITRAMFKDKIVLVGATAAALGDIKSAPHDARFPGVEVHATAIANMLQGRSVTPVRPMLLAVITVFAGVISSIGVIWPRFVGFKLLVVATVATSVTATAFLLFTRGQKIVWLSPVAPLMAATLAALGGFAWSYFVEDKKARLLLRALEQCLSPEVAAQLARDPRKLSVGGRQMEMTVMFTDLAGFTALTEKLGEKIEEPLNYYLGEMSAQILDVNGTLDKYIGDAILTFWNAPVDQPDHARFACEAALAVQRREREIAGRMAEMGVTDTITRIGINTGKMVVGFMGSERKLNYTVIGDSVNMAARLEPANKLYGTQILVAEPTASRVKDLFLFRQVDQLRVKGKSVPMAVYELMGDAAAKNSRLGDLAAGFERALRHYFKQEWDQAEAILLELGERFPDDGPISGLRARIADFRMDPPPPDWDGVYVAKSK